VSDGTTLPGTGVVVASDDAGAAGQVQIIKIAISADGSATVIPADATDGLLVNLGPNNDVTVSNVVPGGTSNSLGKTEDAAHASGDTGVMALAVRTDTASARATTDGDYIPLIVDSSGRLHVNVGLLSALVAGSAIIGKTTRAETSFTLQVANAGQISAAADVAGYSIVGIVVPSTFDGTQISFQVSHDAITYQQLFDASNTAVVMTVAASRTYAPWAELQGWRAIKIVTTTAQTGATDFVIQVQS